MSAAAYTTASGPAIERILEAVTARGSKIERPNAEGFVYFQCPAHDDRTPSAWVRQGDGRASVGCQAGCKDVEVLQGLGLGVRDLFDERRGTSEGEGPRARRTVAARHHYVDAKGNLLATKLRFADGRKPKCRWDGVGPSQDVLYRLPELLAALAAGDRVLITEGEKCADAVHAAGGVATSGPHGSNRWPDSLSEAFRGTSSKVMIVADRDEPGQKHALRVRESLESVGVQADIRRSRDGNDAADHLEAGFGLDDLIPVPLEAKPRIRLLTAEEFETDLAPDPLIEKLLFEASTHNLAGASKVGKSWAAYQLAASVAAGVPFLGLRVPKPAPVLLLSLELSAGMVRERLRSIARDTGTAMPTVGENFHIVAPTRDYVPSLDLTAQEGRDDLSRLTTDSGAKLVILDTLYRFIPGIDPSENGQMGEVYGHMNDLAAETGAGFLILDHVRKGEHVGPVSQYGLGAQVKGGAARVIIALKRTSKDGGGRWEVDVESHFGSWDEPLYYERPQTADGGFGGGCVPCTASEAHGVDYETLQKLFQQHGELREGQLVISSKKKLGEAIQAEGLASGNGQAGEVVTAILRDHCAREESIGPRKDAAPIWTRDGARNATEFHWRMGSSPSPSGRWGGQPQEDEIPW